MRALQNGQRADGTTARRDTTGSSPLLRSLDPPTARPASARAGDSSTGAGGHHFGRVAVFPLLPSGAQAKPIVGPPAERCEVEADRIADRMARFGASADPHPRGDGGGAGSPSGVGGVPLSAAARAPFESSFGRSLASVRIHSDGAAAQSVEAAGAHAYTVGADVYFGPGKFAPETARGQHLLAHELTHVVQQGAAGPSFGSGGPAAAVRESAPRGVQGSFFGDVWEGVKSAASAVGSFVAGAAEVVGGALRDTAMLIGNLVRDLPGRLARLAETLVEGVVGVVTFIPEMIASLAEGGISGLGAFLWDKLKRGGAWVLTLVSRAFDLVGGPEAAELAMHILSLGTTPLTGQETNDAKGVLGDQAVRWGDVRVAEGGIMHLVFLLNHDRAFTSFHTINISAHERTRREIMVHELTHVYQYETVGSLYLGQAIHAQATIGYGYRGATGLREDRAAGKHYRDYNREQQAQIAQDFFALPPDAADRAAYEPFIAELRAGNL